MERRSRFASQAEVHGVPVEVVEDAAAYVWEMLDQEQRVEVVAEAQQRWKATRAMRAADSDGPADGQTFVVQEGDTTVVFAGRRNVLRDDLVYRLMHERFDCVYAIALRASDAPEGSDHAEWLFVPPRPGEQEAPAERGARMVQALMVGLRRAKQRCESLRASALRHLAEESK